MLFLQASFESLAVYDYVQNQERPIKLLTGLLEERPRNPEIRKRRFSWKNPREGIVTVFKTICNYGTMPSSLHKRHLERGWMMKKPDNMYGNMTSRSWLWPNHCPLDWTVRPPPELIGSCKRFPSWMKYYLFNSMFKNKKSRQGVWPLHIFFTNILSSTKLIQEIQLDTKFNSRIGLFVGSCCRLIQPLISFKQKEKNEMMNT